MAFDWKLQLGIGARDRKQGGGCLRCGQCCEAFGGHLSASRADLERWRRAGRDDILAWVGASGWLWVDPATHRLLGACPYLRRTDPEHAECAIQDLKPDICRAYPTLAHGRRCLRGGFLGLVPVGLAAVDAAAPLLAAF